jgi:Uma2 family endonuclease
MTVEDLDALERDTDIRHELVDGIAYAMVGASADHGAIVAGAVIALGSRLRRPCQVFSESVRLRRLTDIRDDYFYPDVMVACDPTDRASHHREHPVVLVEVLSPSTANVDRGRKREIYTAIPSLEHYLIVAQTHMAIEQCDRSNDWQPTHLGADDTLDLPALSLTIPVRDFYVQVDL